MNTKRADEIVIDALTGPTHHFGGLSLGNVASMKHRAKLSNPKGAALESLEKMKLIADLGVTQVVLPYHARPAIDWLRKMGFEGSEQKVLEEAFSKAPHLLLQMSSSAAMWTANSATVTPSSDSLDGKVHITPANLAFTLHRALETAWTANLLHQLFSKERFFCHHAPLPSCYELFDEGAANQVRLCSDFGAKGLELFFYGRDVRTFGQVPKKYPPRPMQPPAIPVAAPRGITGTPNLAAMTTAFCASSKLLGMTTAMGSIS